MDEWARLLLAARDNGDMASYREFVSLSYPEVRRFVAERVGVDRVDDVVQGVFERAWRTRGDFQEEAGVGTWLLAIVRGAAGGGGPRR